MAPKPPMPEAMMQAVRVRSCSLAGCQPAWARAWSEASSASGMKRSILRWSLGETTDRKSTRLNSSHLVISYAVFCLKKKKERGESVLLEGGQGALLDLEHATYPHSTSSYHTAG